MTPRFSLLYVLDGCGGQIIEAGNGNTGLARHQQRLNLDDIGFMQLGEKRLGTLWNLSSDVNSVPRVFGRRVPFQICESIVRLITVTMIYLGFLIGRFTEKRHRYKSMNETRYLRFIRWGIKPDAQVSAVVEFLFRKIVATFLRRQRVSYHSPQIRDRVHAFVPDNGQPNFVIKFFGGKVGISHLQKITPFVNRSGLKDYLRNLSACFYFTTPLTGGVR